MTVLADRYELGPPLGAGGMASVVLGHDRLLDRPVAVKLLDQSVDEDARQRFLREARAAARLHHANAVQVFDTGEHAGRPFIVMEHVRGRSVADLLRAGNAFEIEEAVAITLGVLNALAAAHAVGILHRDVKPANVLLPDEGGVKLADFGIAKAVDDATVGLTSTGAVIGTPSYLAPEVVEGLGASPASDVYSTGCMLYELLTGDPPFQGDSAISVAYAHTRMPAPRVQDRRPDVPDDLALVVAQALAKDPADRYATAEAMSHALLEGPEPAAAAAATRLMAPASAAEDLLRTDADPVGDAPPRDRQGPSWALLAGVAALVVVLAIVIALLRGDPEVAGDEPGTPADGEQHTADDTETSPEEVDDAVPDPGDDGPAADETPADDTEVDDPVTDQPPAAGGLGSLMGRLASAQEGEYGEKQEDLLEDLRDVIRASEPGEQADDARELREDLAEWVANGEIDPAIAAEADEFLAPIAEG